LREQLTWQPIETAPLAVWVYTWGDPMFEKPVMGCIFGERGWRTFGGAPLNPTHYFPIPIPPLPKGESHET